MSAKTNKFYQINPVSLNWESKSSYLFFNEKQGDKKLFKAHIPLLPHLKAHIWLATSGRTEQKWVALSKKALLVSAKAVNQHLKACSKDRWGIGLPLFHVGGLSILARAFLSQSAYFFYKPKWQAKSFHRFLIEKKIALCSLVPTQVFDLIKEGFKAPPSLRAVVVGGESLNFKLYQSALRLNWPLLPSYGLTECSSQVATAELISLNKKSFGPPFLKILPHVQAKVYRGEISLKSESLFTGFIPLSKSTQKPPTFIRAQKWYKTGDKGQIKQGKYLQIERPGSIKILGEKVNMTRLKELFMTLLLKNSFSGKIFLFTEPSQREGFQVALVTNSFEQNALNSLLKQFNQKVSPFERIKAIYIVPDLPLTSLSKLNQTALKKKLNF